MSALLDVNVLIALIDRRHGDHRPAQRWFGEVGMHDWVTCPLTENGVLRIVGHPRYPNTSGPPIVIAEVLSRMRSIGRHRFWPDDISLLNPDLVDREALTSHSQITDTYLLALAVSHGGRFATFDRRLKTDAVRGGRDALVIIDRA